jgi:hypothetical protein
MQSTLRRIHLKIFKFHVWTSKYCLVPQPQPVSPVKVVGGSCLLSPGREPSPEIHSHQCWLCHPHMTGSILQHLLSFCSNLKAEQHLWDQVCRVWICSSLTSVFKLSWLKVTWVCVFSAERWIQQHSPLPNKRLVSLSEH